jgi:glutathione peroxidase
MKAAKVNANTAQALSSRDRLSQRRTVVLGAGSMLAIAFAAGWTNRAAAAPAQNCPALLNYTLPRLQDEQPQSLCQFAGKVVLAVNTASACGYTPQYEGLQTLHERYASRGLVIVGFPSADFRQEPKDNKGIAEQCFDLYGVRFPMFAKSGVVGQTANPFFAALARETGEAPKWNFHKYLVDRQGRAVASFPSAVDPLDRRLTGRIEQLLATR